MASLRRLPTLLQVAAAVLCVVVVARAQVVEFGQCGHYQTATSFTEQYIANMISEEGGYVMALTSGRPYSCQELTLYSNKTFKYTTHNAFNVLRNYTGMYTAKVSTFTSPGYIELNLPPAVLGSGLNGRLRLNVLMAEPGYLLVASCSTILRVARSEQMIVFVPRTVFGLDTARTINATLNNLEIRGTQHLNIVPQDCVSRLRGRPSLLDIYNLLVKLGYLPPLPFKSYPISLPFKSSGYIPIDPALAAEALVAVASNDISSAGFYSALSNPTSTSVLSEYEAIAKLLTTVPSSNVKQALQIMFSSQSAAYNNIAPSGQFEVHPTQAQFVSSVAYAKPTGGLAHNAPAPAPLQAILYPQIYNSNAQPVYTNTFSNVNQQPSPGFVQQFGASGSVPTAVYGQQFVSPNVVQYTPFGQKPAVSSQPTYTSTPFSVLTQNSAQVPHAIFKQHIGHVQSAQFGQAPVINALAQPATFAQPGTGSAPSSAFPQPAVQGQSTGFRQHQQQSSSPVYNQLSHVVPAHQHSYAAMSGVQA